MPTAKQQPLRTRGRPITTPVEDIVEALNRVQALVRSFQFAREDARKAIANNQGVAAAERELNRVSDALERYTFVEVRRG